MDRRLTTDLRLLFFAKTFQETHPRFAKHAFFCQMLHRFEERSFPSIQPTFWIQEWLFEHIPLGRLAGVDFLYSSNVTRFAYPEGVI